MKLRQVIADHKYEHDNKKDAYGDMCLIPPLI